ncbi:MAG: hypothetical protein HQM14_11945 [SAR324 cluster bacterium]|nr:hypothetical protein [SAR324 cluster bacterium]
MDTYTAIDNFHAEQQCELRKIEGVYLPLSYGNGQTQEIEAIQTGAGLLDLKAFNLIMLDGPDAADFLQGLVSNDIRLIEIGQIQPNLLPNNKGKILFHIEVFRKTEHAYIVLTNAGEGSYVKSYLDHFHIQEDFEMSLLDPDQIRCDILGPQGLEALQQLGYETKDFNWYFQGRHIMSVPYPLGNILRFVNIIPSTIYLDWMQNLLEKSDRVAQVGFTAFDHVRIDAGIPRVWVDYTREHFPQEASLMNHVSFTKGCYVGQETHARMHNMGHPNWQSVAVRIPVSLQLKTEQALFCGQEKVGTITSLSCIENEAKQRGIAFIKYAAAQDNSALAAEAAGDGLIEQFPLATNR